VNERKILKWLINKEAMNTWTGFVWVVVAWRVLANQKNYY
jgi:hypothetical protein